MKFSKQLTKQGKEEGRGQIQSKSAISDPDYSKLTSYFWQTWEVHPMLRNCKNLFCLTWKFSCISYSQLTRVVGMQISNEQNCHMFMSHVHVLPMRKHQALIVQNIWKLILHKHPLTCTHHTRLTKILLSTSNVNSFICIHSCFSYFGFGSCWIRWIRLIHLIAHG